MGRAILIVMDSFGIGGAPDAAAFGDEGANTFGHILQQLGENAPALPNLARLGLYNALELASGHAASEWSKTSDRYGFHGAAEEVSKGKDTPSGHWEIAGVPVQFDWGYFPHEIPAFPAPLLNAIYSDCNLGGSLGNRHASGTEIIEQLGDEHCQTGKPIFYTSADSVFQIAAHEDETIFGLERLYEVCEQVKKLVEPYNIGRVIARPFTGTSADSYERTGNRRDYAVPPPEPTLLDRAKAAGRNVIAVGKIGDIFAHKGVTDVRKASGNAAIGEATLRALDDAGDGDLVFSNYVDFDMLYGHRRDVVGYANALAAFDAHLPAITGAMRPQDLLIITADHGCDPTWKGTDHTRERVPVLGLLKGVAGPVEIGIRQTFADIGETVAEHLGLPAGPHGGSFLDGLTRDA